VCQIIQFTGSHRVSSAFRKIKDKHTSEKLNSKNWNNGVHVFLWCSNLWSCSPEMHWKRFY